MPTTQMQSTNWKKVDRVDNMEMAIRSFSSNLYGEWVAGPEEFRFVRITKKGEYSYLAVAGSWDADGNPIVAFGSGHSFVEALSALCDSFAGNSWKEDVYAKKKKDGSST